MTERAMQYALLIYTDEAAWEGQSPEERADVMSGYDRFLTDIREKRANRGGERLYPSSTATTVRVRDGVTLLSDGPYAETRDQLAGFFIVEAEDLDEAIRWAECLPGARLGAIEVRPVVLIPTPQRA